MSNLKAKAVEIKLWLDSELGKEYVTVLSLKYNELHQAAEGSGLSPYEKATLVDQAAGLKFALDWLTTRVQNLEAGVYDAKSERSVDASD